MTFQAFLPINSFFRVNFLINAAFEDTAFISSFPIAAFIGGRRLKEEIR